MKTFKENVFRSPGRDRRIFLYGFLLPLALDVKKFVDQIDSTFQVILVVVSLISAGFYFTLEWFSRDIRFARSKLRSFTALWWMFIAFSPLPVWLWYVDLVHYLKVLLPFVLFGVGLVVMIGVERRRVDPMFLIDLLLWASLLSTFWRIVYAIYIGGLSIETIRWQILSPSTPFLIGYGIGGLYLRRRFKLSAFALLVGLCSALLSITRTYILILFAVLLGLCVIEMRKRSLKGVIKTSIRVGVGIVIIGFVGGAITQHVRPEFFEIWVQRIFKHQVAGLLDITLVTRIAEYSGQFQALKKNAWTLLIGNGIGSDYTWDAKILSLLPFSAAHTTRWFAGHSTWIYPFFANGIIFGTIVPVLMIGVLLSGFKAASTPEKNCGKINAILPFLILLAYFGNSFTANLFHERYTGIILSVVSSSVIILRGNLRQRSPKLDRKGQNFN